jgi:hypothetical protein
LTTENPIRWKNGFAVMLASVNNRLTGNSTAFASIALIDLSAYAATLIVFVAVKAVDMTIRF